MYACLILIASLPVDEDLLYPMGLRKYVSSPNSAGGHVVLV
jgi:hypothetical protein